MISVEDIARTAHEANLVARDTLREQPGVPWAELPEPMRVGLRAAVSLLLEVDELPTPEQNHTSWCTARTAQGWVFGAVYDPETRHHPDLVPFGQLPPEARMKSVVFLAMMRLARQVASAGGVA